MIADTVESEIAADSEASTGVLAGSAGRGAGLRSFGRPMVRFTERWVVPSGDGGLVACVA